ncbi:UDP-N-acetylmuramate dehydrogenase [soil metagenome]
MPDPVSDPIQLETNVPLGPMTTLGIGGPAKYFVRVFDENALVAALNFAKIKMLPVFILGGGSNVLVSDEGFEGLVVHILIDRSKGRIAELESQKVNGNESYLIKITAGAGENWDDVVRFCVTNELAGIECLSGIPGSVGGTPVQNVGAYGQEVSETIVAVRCIDTETLTAVELSNSDCGFLYRKSIFNTMERGRFVVTDVTFALKHNGEPKVEYKDLIEHFGSRKPTLREIRDAVLAIRRKKSMVIDPADPNSRSAGSFFKNPIISVAKFAELNKTRGGGVPNFRAGDGYVKVPAAWLIEEAGFAKGYSRGNVAISANHSLAIINRGHAKSKEIVSLKDEIVSAVEARFGITLVPEPVFLGF